MRGDGTASPAMEVVPAGGRDAASSEGEIGTPAGAREPVRYTAYWLTLPWDVPGLPQSEGGLGSELSCPSASAPLVPGLAAAAPATAVPRWMRMLTRREEVDAGARGRPVAIAPVPEAHALPILPTADGGPAAPAGHEDAAERREEEAADEDSLMQIWPAAAPVMGHAGGARPLGLRTPHPDEPAKDGHGLLQSWVAAALVSGAAQARPEIPQCAYGLGSGCSIGGASALLQATGQSDLVKSLGRWSSEAAHVYSQDLAEQYEGVAEKIANDRSAVHYTWGLESGPWALPELELAIGKP